jgi:hypothetical protein
VPRQKCCVATTGAGERLGTLRLASYGHPRCRGSATCVHDLGHCQPPDDRWGNSSVPGCGPRLRAVRGSLVDRTRERKKSFSCVTTRRRNLWLLTNLRCELRPLAARFLCLGVPGFGKGILAVLGLPPSRLPSTDLPPTFRLLAVALVPAPRPVSAPAPFTKTDPRARSAPSGRSASLSRTLTSAHGRCFLPRESSGRMR